MKIRITLLTMMLAALCGAQSATPELSVSVNGRAKTQLRAGQPLMGQLSVLHPLMLEPRGGEDWHPVVLPALEESWAKAVRVTLYNAQGEAVDVAFTLHTPPEQRLVLNPAEQAEAAWSLSPEQTAALAEGPYLLRATLDTSTIALGDEWNGTLDAGDVAIEVKAPPAEPSVAERAEDLRLRAEYAALRNALDEAIAHTEDWIRLQPENAQAHAMKGELLERAGRTGAAFQYYGQAIAINEAQEHAAERHAREQHGALNQRIADLLRRLSTRQ
jgi:tetratricopeptide (TPR) repeat protein